MSAATAFAESAADAFILDRLSPVLTSRPNALKEGGKSDDGTLVAERLNRTGNLAVYSGGSGCVGRGGGGDCCSHTSSGRSCDVHDGAPQDTSDDYAAKVIKMLDAELKAGLADARKAQKSHKRHAEGIRVKGQLRQELKELFELIDVDGTGSITATDLSKAMAKIDLHPPKQEVVALLNKVDANHTGSVELPEFIKLWTLHMMPKLEDADAADKFGTALEHMQTDEIVLDTMPLVARMINAHTAVSNCISTYSRPSRRRAHSPSHTNNNSITHCPTHANADSSTHTHMHPRTNADLAQDGASANASQGQSTLSSPVSSPVPLRPQRFGENSAAGTVKGEPLRPARGLNGLRDVHSRVTDCSSKPSGRSPTASRTRPKHELISGDLASFLPSADLREQRMRPVSPWGLSADTGLGLRGSIPQSSFMKASPRASLSPGRSAHARAGLQRYGDVVRASVRMRAPPTNVYVKAFMETDQLFSEYVALRDKYQHDWGGKAMYQREWDRKSRHFAAEERARANDEAGEGGSGVGGVGGGDGGGGDGSGVCDGGDSGGSDVGRNGFGGTDGIGGHSHSGHRVGRRGHSGGGLSSAVECSGGRAGRFTHTRVEARMGNELAAGIKSPCATNLGARRKFNDASGGASSRLGSSTLQACPALSQSQPLLPLYRETQASSEARESCTSDRFDKQRRSIDEMRVRRNHAESSISGLQTKMLAERTAREVLGSAHIASLDLPLMPTPPSTISVLPPGHAQTAVFGAGNTMSGIRQRTMTHSASDATIPSKATASGVTNSRFPHRASQHHRFQPQPRHPPEDQQQSPQHQLQLPPRQHNQPRHQQQKHSLSTTRPRNGLNYVPGLLEIEWLTQPGSSDAGAQS